MFATQGAFHFFYDLVKIHRAAAVPDTASFNGKTRVAEWVADERKCCPFFTFEIWVEGETGALRLSLKGREGVKPFIKMEFHIT